MSLTASQTTMARRLRSDQAGTIRAVAHFGQTNEPTGPVAATLGDGYENAQRTYGGTHKFVEPFLRGGAAVLDVARAAVADLRLTVVLATLALFAAVASTGYPGDSGWLLDIEEVLSMVRQLEASGCCGGVWMSALTAVLIGSLYMFGFSYALAFQAVGMGLIMKRKWGALAKLCGVGSGFRFNEAR